MIRKATPADASMLSKLIIMAMGPLAATFVNSNEQEKAVQLFERFAALTNNQYSYENSLVYCNNGGVQGMICAYNGAELNKLREPFISYITREFGFTGTPEDETRAGEYYIDCISVAPDMRKQGIGKQLIKALIEQGRINKWPAIGLLVNKTNPSAQKLYNTLGFKIKGEKLLLGTDNYHMQYDLLENSKSL